jgi:two-component system, OmpR family, KDP operon response regulator KdpE
MRGWKRRMEMTEYKALVLVIEDEIRSLRFLHPTLDSQGYRIIEAKTGMQGIAQAASHNPDMILLDLGLPDIDGVEVVKRIREWSDTPIIILSARELESDKVAALDAGADDYLVKPFGVQEMLARMRAVLRWKSRINGETQEPVYTMGDVVVDLSLIKVTKGGKEVHLTPTEFKLLTALIKHRGKVLTPQFLLDKVWGRFHSEQTHYVRLYIKQLREKLEDEPGRPKYIVTESRVGYRLKDD